MLFNYNKGNKHNKKKTILLDAIDEPVDVKDNQQKFNSLYKPYELKEFISCVIIPNIMKRFFNTAELLLSFTDNHLVYKIKIYDLLSEAIIDNWEFNRPPDIIRCQDIAQYIYQSKKQIDTMIYLSYNNTKQKFEVIDGIHRITALKLLNCEMNDEINSNSPMLVLL